MSGCPFAAETLWVSPPADFKGSIFKSADRYRHIKHAPWTQTSMPLLWDIALIASFPPSMSLTVSSLQVVGFFFLNLLRGAINSCSVSPSGFTTAAHLCVCVCVFVAATAVLCDVSLLAETPYYCGLGEVAIELSQLADGTKHRFRITCLPFSASRTKKKKTLPQHFPRYPAGTLNFPLCVF